MTLPDSYNISKEFSEARIAKLRSALGAIANSNQSVIVNGSYARREASVGSDVDYFVLSQSSLSPEADAFYEAVEKTVSAIVPHGPAEGGAFGKAVSRIDLLNNIGGDADSNQNITRRMLFLLEGEWLVNKSGFDSLRTEIVTKYIEQTGRDHQLALFLLNDVIRYWRTMTVDYAYKTSEKQKPKAWAIRNIKLVFSRKLMYAGGLFAVGRTADLRKDRKIEMLRDLFAMPPIERLVHICESASLSRVLRSYGYFLQRMQDEKIREHLSSLDSSNAVDAVFRDLKNESHLFTRDLLTTFEQTFHSTHPIRRAVIF